MPNFATVLKEEVVRLARKEIRAETEKLRKAATQYRSDIAALKRRLTTLEQRLAKLEKTAARPAPPQPDPDGATRSRFTAKGFRAQRERLALSAAAMGKLIGVSAQTIYNYEAGTTQPRRPIISAIGSLRKLGKREVAARLQALA